MRTLSAAIVLLALTSSALAADWKAKLAADRVRLVGGKMVIEEYSLCKNTIPGASKSSLQIKSYAEAPANGPISRDFLVSFESTMQTASIMAMGTALAQGTKIEPLKALDCDEISAPIGKVDLELNLYLTSDGWQMAVVDGSTGKTTQESSGWEDTLGK